MKNFSSVVLVIFPLIIPQDLNGKELSKHLLGFENFIDKKFKGEFYNSTKENPLIDVIYFERILNGNAISISHSVNNGVYGGKSIIVWNSKNLKLESYYFSTGGEMIQSHVSTEKNEIVMVEDFSKNDNGIQKVKKIYRLGKDGILEYQIKYFMNNIWVNSHDMEYNESKSAEIIFQ